MILINAKNRALGRVCSEVAEKLLKNDDVVVVVNSRQSIISGKREQIFHKYEILNDKKGKGNPFKNQINPRYPDQLLKRTVRGMLPRNAKGNDALKRLKVYIDVPEMYVKDLPAELILPSIMHITLEELSLHLGAKLKK